MDILDLFNDGGLDPAEFQNVRSEEELKKWTTEENLPEGRKALTLLTKGFALQKVAVLNNVHRLGKEREFADILTLIFRELPTWEEMLQVEAGNGFLNALGRNSILQVHLEPLLKVTLTLLSTWSEAVHHVWLEVFAKLLTIVPVQMIKRHCVPIALHLGEFSQAVSTRVVATQIIGLLAEAMQEEFKNDILQKALLLTQDTSLDIRKHMCVQMKKICRAIGEESHSRVFAEVLKLINDEEIEVKREALSLLVDIIDLLPCDFIREHVLPTLREDFLPTRDPLLHSQMAQLCGLFIVKLEAEMQDDEFRTQTLNFFQSLVVSQNDNERKIAAFNFPAVLSTLGATAFSEDLKGMYEMLCKDQSLEVRLTMAASLHEVIRLAPSEKKLFCEVFDYFLEEPKIANVLAKNFNLLLPQLASELNLTLTLSRVAALLQEVQPWRTLQALLNQLIGVVSLFAVQETTEILQPTLFSLFPQVCLPVKYSISALLSRLVYLNYITEKRNELCQAICALMRRSVCAQDRIVFVDFCVEILKLNSRNFFLAQFYQELLRVMEDPVINVRLKAAKHLITFHCSFCTDPEMLGGLSAVISRMTADPDSEVSRLAGEVQMQVMSPDYWNSVQAADRQEQEKLQREEQQSQQEQREREEAKKRLVQDLTEKARMEYLQQYKDKRLGVLAKKSGKPASLPTRPLAGKAKTDGKNEVAKIATSTLALSPRASTSPLPAKPGAKPVNLKKK